MSLEPRTIVHENALVFVQEVEKAIHEGLRVTDTNAGAPMLNTYLKEVNMVPAAVAVAGPAELIKFSAEGSTVTVEGYENLPFLLTVQEAVLAGFSVKSVEFVPHGLKSAVLEKATKQPVQAAPKAEPVIDASVAPTPAQPKTSRRSGKTK